MMKNLIKVGIAAVAVGIVGYGYKRHNDNRKKRIAELDSEIKIYEQKSKDLDELRNKIQKDAEAQKEEWKKADAETKEFFKELFINQKEWNEMIKENERLNKKVHDQNEELRKMAENFGK